MYNNISGCDRELQKISDCPSVDRKKVFVDCKRISGRGQRGGRLYKSIF
jgi:hypothetical protein